MGELKRPHTRARGGSSSEGFSLIEGSSRPDCSRSGSVARSLHGIRPPQHAGSSFAVLARGKHVKRGERTHARDTGLVTWPLIRERGDGGPLSSTASRT